RNGGRGPATTSAISAAPSQALAGLRAAAQRACLEPPLAWRTHMSELEEVAQSISGQCFQVTSLDQAREIVSARMPDETPQVIDGVAHALFMAAQAKQKEK